MGQGVFSIGFTYSNLYSQWVRVYFLLVLHKVTSTVSGSGYMGQGVFSIGFTYSNLYSQWVRVYFLLVLHKVTSTVSGSGCIFYWFYI